MLGSPADFRSFEKTKNKRGNLLDIQARKKDLGKKKVKVAEQ
jgi:hypothetical protein